MKLTIEVPDRHINGALAAPHSRYWCSQVKIDGGIGWAVDSGDEKPKKIRLTLTRVRIGLLAMQKHNPSQFAALCSGDYDGVTGDVLLQFMCFGQEKYG